MTFFYLLGLLAWNEYTFLTKNMIQKFKNQTFWGDQFLGREFQDCERVKTESECDAEEN